MWATMHDSNNLPYLPISISNIILGQSYRKLLRHALLRVATILLRSIHWLTLVYWFTLGTHALPECVPHSILKSPSRSLSNIALRSYDRRLTKSLHRVLPPEAQYQIAISYHGMIRMYHKNMGTRLLLSWLPSWILRLSRITRPFPCILHLSGGRNAPRCTRFSGSYIAKVRSIPPPPPLRYINHATGTRTAVGVGTAHILGAGEGLFACKSLPFKEGRCRAEDQAPICSYVGIRLTYAQFQLLPPSACSYLWGPNSKPGCIPPPDWFCVDARDPNSCYGRYSNDPFDDEKVDAKILRNKSTNTIHLYPTREILAGEEIYISYGPEYWDRCANSPADRALCLHCSPTINNK